MSDLSFVSGLKNQTGQKSCGNCGGNPSGAGFQSAGKDAEKNTTAAFYRT
jgi:hypothetical protein